MHFGEQLVIFLNLMILVYVSNHRFESLTPRAEAHNAVILAATSVRICRSGERKGGKNKGLTPKLTQHGPSG